MSRGAPFGYRISKPPDQVAAEALDAAAAELRQVMRVIRAADASDLLQGPAGAAGLIPTASSLYSKHVSLIEAEALEYVDGSSDLGESPAARLVGAVFGRPMRRRPAVHYPEPEPDRVDNLTPICLQCAQPLGDHVGNECPLSKQ